MPQCGVRHGARAASIMSERPLDPELNRLVEIARRAAERVMEHYHGSVKVDLKGPNDPVTEADREADDFICGELRRQFPDAEVVGEESAPSTPTGIANLAQKRAVFYVDPLDGTKEFIAKNGEFSVLIGLCVDGRPKLGVIALPVEGRVLAGRVGERAVSLDREGCCRRLALSTKRRLEDVTLLVSRSHTPPLAVQVQERAGFARVLPCGSVGVKISRLLEGHADAYLHDGGGLKRWDCCGPEAVLLAAGGAITDLRGTPLCYESERLTVDGGLVATNGFVHPSLLSNVAAVQADVAKSSDQAV
jgi:3'(2'), 5'-bisphosphate nucleotidase